MPQQFPFSAVVGSDDMALALIGSVTSLLVLGRFHDRALKK